MFASKYENVDHFITCQVEAIQKQLDGKKAICALSGGVDSSVSAALVHRAAPGCLTCVFVDGLMRLNERTEIVKFFKEQFNLPLTCVDAREYFLTRLAGVTDPEQKRKIIGEGYIRLFEAEASKQGTFDFLVQGTIYPDIVESGTPEAALIKSHHNVGGLPETIRFSGLIEPLRALYKYEVRETGLALGIPAHIVNRQPFPGPGLAVRCIGEVTAEKLDILRMADSIMREEIEKAELEKDIFQYFAILTDMRSVGVKYGRRVYGYTVALRAVRSTHTVTAEWVRLPYDVLEKVSQRIVEEIDPINRVVYDITAKPPGTIEWE